MGVRPSEKTCKDDEKVYETMFFANSVVQNGPDIYFEFHDMDFFRNVIANDNDGLAIDVVLREQLPCNRENQFHPSEVHDGEMQRPIYKYDIFRTNISDNPGKMLVKIGEVPKYLRNRQWDANIIIINDNKLCEYSIPVEIPSDIYPLLPIRPYMDLSNNSFEKQKGKTVRIKEAMHIEVQYNRARKNYFDYNEGDYNLLMRWAPYIKSGSVNCFASVEGPFWLNKMLLDERDNNVFDLLSAANVPLSVFNFESAENWDMMNTQIVQNKLDYLKDKSNDYIKYYLKSHPSAFFDSLLLAQRSTHIYATVDTVLTISNYDDYLFANEFSKDVNLNELPWNKILREEYILKDEPIQTALIDSLVKEKNYRTNLLGAATIEKTPYFIDSILAEKLFKDRDFKDDLERFNYAHLITNYWFARFSRGYKLKGVAPTITPNELREIISNLDTLKIKQTDITRLKVNVLLSGIHYYVAHNNWSPVNNYFNEIVQLVKEGNFTPQEAYELALFCNHFHKFDKAVAILHEFYLEKTLTENGYFALAATATLIRNKLDENQYYEYMETAKSVNKKRYCKWLDDEFQIQRDEFLKKDFCTSCSSQYR